MTQAAARRPRSVSARPVRAVRAAALAAVLVGPLAVLPAAPAAADDTAFTIDDQRITESSGLATDQAAGVYWTVGDNAPGRVFALQPDGKVKAVVSYGARVTDVEGLARAGERLYIGDIGDNQRKRKFVTVYSLLNPAVRDGSAMYRAWDFTYPGGKAHNAEALLVSRTGQVYIVTKEKKGGIYTYDGAPSPQGTNRLRRVADAPAYVTDGTFLPDGRMALRTYVGVYVLDRGHKVVAQAPLPFQPQGETITPSLDGGALLVGSEGRPSPVLTVPVPTAVEQVPTGPAKAPTAAPEDDTDDARADDGRSGTRWAVGIAAGVAVLAGLVTALVGGRAAGRRVAEPHDDREHESPDDE